MLIFIHELSLQWVSSGNTHQRSAHQEGVGKRRENCGACLQERQSRNVWFMGESAGGDPSCLLSPSFPPTLWVVYVVWVLSGDCPSCLPLPLASPPSESSLQEIKGFKRRSRVSYGALWLSGIAGSDWKTKPDSVGQRPETILRHIVKGKLSLWCRRIQTIDGHLGVLLFS